MNNNIKVFVDPIEGWKYGFPKFYIKSNKPENLNKWLTDNGYPAQTIIDYGKSFRYATWEEEKEKDLLDLLFPHDSDSTSHYMYSRKRSYIEGNQIFVYLPNANGKWFWDIMERVKEFCKEDIPGFQQPYPRGDSPENYLIIELHKK
jgi:hypothetical protein